MANSFSADDILDFLDHAGDRGLMPAATAQALAVATRNVLGVLSDDEKKAISNDDLEGIVRRFTNKRAKDFNPASLKEYGRRVHRAIGLFLQWREDPANFSVKTRSTTGARKNDKPKIPTTKGVQEPPDFLGETKPSSAGSYNSSLPVRPGVVVTLANLPDDLTKAEAERLSAFVRMLAIES